MKLPHCRGIRTLGTNPALVSRLVRVRFSALAERPRRRGMHNHFRGSVVVSVERRSPGPQISRTPAPAYRSPGTPREADAEDRSSFERKRTQPRDGGWKGHDGSLSVWSLRAQTAVRWHPPDRRFSGRSGAAEGHRLTPCRSVRRPACEDSRATVGRSATNSPRVVVKRLAMWRTLNPAER